MCFEKLPVNLRNKLPAAGQIAQVFAVTCLLVYGWTIYGFALRVPTWLYYLNAGEILSNFSYSAVFDLLEASLVVAVILIVNLLLPRKVFMDRFVARASLLVVLSLGYLMVLAVDSAESRVLNFPAEEFRLAPFVLLALLLLAVLLPRVEIVRKVAEDFADRALILLYVLLPLSALGLIIFLFNNLF